MKVSVGFFIRRTYLLDSRGKTWCAYPQTLYPTFEAARDALVIGECGGHLDSRYKHDVTEVFMHIDEETTNGP